MGYTENISTSVFKSLYLNKRVHYDESFLLVFGLMIVKSQGVNGNSFTYDWLKKILWHMNDIVATLQDHPMNRISTMQRYKLDNLQSRLKHISERLKCHPNDGFERHEASPDDM